MVELAQFSQKRSDDLELVQRALLFTEFPSSMLSAIAALYIDSLSRLDMDAAVNIIGMRRTSVEFNDSFLISIREGLILGILSLWIEDPSLIEDYLLTKDISSHPSPETFAQVRADIMYSASEYAQLS